jgi:hypothetical protein
MKFLCLACDEPMKLAESTPPADGAGLTATFRCPRCGHGIAMLTNTWETEVVGSLGVKLANGRASRCPLGAMVSGAKTEAAATDDGLTWTAGALARLERIPEMVRSMARDGVERFARDAGHGVVDEAVLEAARARLGVA